MIIQYKSSFVLLGIVLIGTSCFGSVVQPDTPSDSILQQTIKESFPNPTANSEAPTVNIQENCKNIEKSQQDLFYETIPEQYQSFFELDTPQPNSVLYKNEIIIKGKNKLLTSVFVNGKPVTLTQDGKFAIKEILPSGNRHLFIISFTNQEAKPIHIIRKILRLNSSPNDLSNFPQERKEIIYFLNSAFIEHPPVNLSETITRAELAYFIYSLKNTAFNEKLTQPVYSDVPADFWAAPAIQYATQEGILTEYPDGKFHPNKTVKKLEYLIAIIRALQIKLSQPVNKLPFQDINDAYWTLRYIKTALDSQLIPAGKVFYPEKDLTYSEFILLAIRIPQVKSELEKISALGNIKCQSTDIVKINQQILPILNETKKLLINQQGIELVTPANQTIIYTPQLQIEGKITPPGNFAINGQSFQSEPDGHFNLTLEVQSQINTFTFSVLDTSKTISVYYLNSYKDTKGHWLEPILAKAKYLQFIENAPNFNPKHTPTKAEIAHYISTFLELPSAIQIENPDKVASKIEAITIIVKLSNLIETTPTTSVKLAYRDLPSTHWGYPYAAAAYYQHLISDAKRFSPNKPITKAELIAILSKLPTVQAKFNSIFK